MRLPRLPQEHPAVALFITHVSDMIVRRCAQIWRLEAFDSIIQYHVIVIKLIDSTPASLVVRANAVSPGTSSIDSQGAKACLASAVDESAHDSVAPGVVVWPLA